MPIYEYRCNQCGEEFEKMVRFSEVDLSPSCPTCESQDTHKQLSTVASFVSAFSAGSSTVSSCGSHGGFS